LQLRNQLVGIALKIETGIRNRQIEVANTFYSENDKQQDTKWKVEHADKQTFD
jgi:hypothetical protein